jgi:protein-tyrosine kinase
VDFIQSAIERARQQRGEGGRAARPDGPARTAGPGATGLRIAEAGPQPDRAALWAALPEFAPRAKSLDRNLIVTHRGGGEAAHFDMIRTRLLHQMRANDWNRVAITSPGGACGKTTLALNLAFSLARQPDLYTLLTEFDLRRPAIARFLGIRGSRQFARVLAGRDAPENHLLRIGDNLAVAVNTAPTEDAAELLQAVAAGHAMDAIEARYAPDVVICDMSPMLLADDTLAFLDQIDCALLVAAAERTTMAEIERCSTDLAARTNFLGVVLNKCRYLERSEGYGYGYGY